jgi:hypothetical protein
VRDAVFLLGLTVTFVVQLVEAADVIAKPRNPGTVNTIASLVIVCFLIGIARAWELIGGPTIGIGREVTALVQDHHRGADDRVGKESPTAPSREARP